ncbi:hypothetical protein BVG79_01247 [Ketogulonicigenium robustum]|uniref:Uncharacterized protein n=1 Tax=Ketogulonicigenium robustum TaxID=92947 RepID=A0A1W6NZM2_9RHOB|nr:hypothetical protein BVG79_01247 [Ketogulonicigenium robustum]
MINAPSAIFAHQIAANPDLTLHEAKPRFLGSAGHVQPPLDNRLVRQVINYATNRDAFVQTLLLATTVPQTRRWGRLCLATTTP